MMIYFCLLLSNSSIALQNVFFKNDLNAKFTPFIKLHHVIAKKTVVFSQEVKRK